MGFGSTVLPIVYSGLIYWLVPNTWKTVRITTAVYGLSVLLVWLISSQIGSNITRLPMLFAGVALVAALPFTVVKSRKWYALVVAIVGFVGWIGFKSADDASTPSPPPPGRASWRRSSTSSRRSARGGAGWRPCRPAPTGRRRRSRRT